MIRRILVGVRVLDPDAPSGSLALEITGDRVTSVGPVAAARTDGAEVHDLDGAVVTPAFVDAHVHATSTGLLVDGLDLTGCADPRTLLDAVAARATARPGALIWGHGWQELGWPHLPSRAEIDRAAAGAPVYLSRIDVHSALVSTGLLDRAPGAVGATGWSDGTLSADAHHHVRRAALAAVDGTVRAAAQRAFLRDAAARGVAVVHECAGPDISSAVDLAALRTLDGPEVVGYWGQAVRDVDEARDLLAATGAHGLAGDLFVDGSVGSRTAALRDAYTDAPGCTGNRYLDADAVGAHITACTLAGVQAGFHVIGDAAADTLTQGLRIAATATSVQALRTRTHRVEHLEMVDAEQRAVLAELGVVASVQPVFDALWGGPSGMYAERLGVSRAAPMNPLAALAGAGVTLALGSDSPVTPVGPWAAVRAAVEHRTPGSGITREAAVAAHTVGGHRAAGDHSATAGRLVVGAPASYAVWDGAGDPAPRCLLTVHRGTTLHSVRSGGVASSRT
ncbi:amidohydrolase family protein [Pseudonocardia sp. 73-21]|uniref:amidohydrolase n=1 Tax=Pseudonocardia sp. 73-21 TaxID=1895809 RepID=UPI002613668D|nr:amidohydrolase family protein [Pseudonocardia sp. 73-21]